jgi:hypothetical protein
MRQWLEKVALRTLPTLRPDTRLREVNTDDSNNQYRYLYHVYYPHQQKGTWLRLPYYALLCFIKLIRHNKA